MEFSDAQILWMVERFDERGKRGVRTGRGTSADLTANKLGISAHKVQRARKVIDFGTKEIQLAVLDGKLSINQAKEMIEDGRKSLDEELAKWTCPDCGAISMVGKPTREVTWKIWTKPRWRCPYCGHTELKGW